MIVFGYIALDIYPWVLSEASVRRVSGKSICSCLTPERFSRCTYSDVVVFAKGLRDSQLLLLGTRRALLESVPLCGKIWSVTVLVCAKF